MNAKIYSHEIQLLVIIKKNTTNKIDTQPIEKQKIDTQQNSK